MSEYHDSRYRIGQVIAAAIIPYLDFSLIEGLDTTQLVSPGEGLEIDAEIDTRLLLLAASVGGSLALLDEEGFSRFSMGILPVEALPGITPADIETFSTSAPALSETEQAVIEKAMFSTFVISNSGFVESTFGTDLENLNEIRTTPFALFSGKPHLLEGVFNQADALREAIQGTLKEAARNAVKQIRKS